MKTLKPEKLPAIDFDLRQLEIFKKVVELKSFSKAAEAVALAQASVSERIATLENMVGTRLLDRMGRQVVPTRAGELLYRHAQRLLHMKQNACMEMEAFLGAKRGELHIGASTIPGEYILPGILGAFRRKYPQVSIKLTIADTTGIQSRVLEGDCDLGLIGSKNTHPNLTSREIWEDELYIALPPHHRWAQKKAVPVELLLEEPFILREVGSGTRNTMEGYLRKSGLKDFNRLHVVARLGSSTAVKEGIKAGLGISILSMRAMETEWKTGLLKAVRIRGTRMLRSFYLIRDRRKNASPICRAMVDYLLTTAEEKGGKDN